MSWGRLLSGFHSLPPALLCLSTYLILQVSCYNPGTLLSLTYDHCRPPQVLSREDFSCQCPENLVKQGDTCICEDCLYSSDDEIKYTASQTNSLPEYMSDFLRDMDKEEEDDGGMATRTFPNYGSARSGDTLMKRKAHSPVSTRFFQRGLKTGLYKVSPMRRSSSHHPRGGLAIIPVRFLTYHEERPMHGRRTLTEGRKRLFKLVSDMKVLRLKPPKPTRAPPVTEHQPETEEPLTEEAPTEEAPRTTEGLEGQEEEEGAQGVRETFSGSVLGGETEGKAASGADTASGHLSGHQGTGSMSMATGMGSAGAAAFTGQGDALMTLHSDGAAASGHSLVGAKAKKGSGTSSLLIGQGDAVALNSYNKKASASATAVATQQTASAGSAAVGAASASAAATPGKKGASSDAAFNEGIGSAASVKGKGGPMAETAAVGNAQETLQDVLGEDTAPVHIGFHKKKKPKPDWMGDDFMMGDILN